MYDERKRCQQFEFTKTRSAKQEAVAVMPGREARTRGNGNGGTRLYSLEQHGPNSLEDKFVDFFSLSLNRFIGF